MDSIPGYDGWKTATPWDDEVSMTVTYTCHACESEIEDSDAIGSRGCDEVIVHCPECDAENSVNVGRD
jgi:hypothetical protein